MWGIRWWDNLVSMWMMYEVEVNGSMDGMVCVMVVPMNGMMGIGMNGMIGM
jgi:hypothetical protein